MTTIPTGRFVWFEYVSTQAAKAQGFFGEVFGWGTQNVPMPQGAYTMISVGNDTIGGYLPTPKGAPEHAHWISHLQVTSAADAAAKVESLGGKIAAQPFKVGDFGTMAVVKDPLGAVFALWQPAKADGTGDYKGQPNNWCWNELVTQDAAKSLSFYKAIGGFTDKSMDMGPAGTYHVLGSDGKDRAGVMTAQKADIPQSWLPYVHVANADTTIERAKKLGATVMHPPENVPNVGRIAVFIDPQGAPIGILQPAS